MESVHIVDAGLVDYESALEMQEEAALKAEQGGCGTLLLLEHPPVITCGRHGGEEHLLVSPEYLAGRGIAVYSSTRGGNVTCHFPGQLVAYPVIRLDRRPGGVRGHFHDLEEVAIRTLRVYGVTAERIPGRPGVWTKGSKIASIGVGVRRWVTRHGLSLNVHGDLRLFDAITPCGLADARLTSMAMELGGAQVAMEDVKGVFAEQFKAVYAHS